MRSAKHAYLIMAHTDKYLLQVLVRMLDDERNDIYLHVDKKWKEFSPSFLSVVHANLYILDKRIDARWGHANLIEVEYNLFEEAYRRGGYLYYHLLSGVDLPIKSQDYIHRFFYEHQGTEFVSYWDPHQPNYDAKLKISRYYLFMKYEKISWRLPSILIAKCRELLGRILPQRKAEYEYKKGSQWISITGRAVSMLLEHRPFVQRRAKYTRAGDEIFLQTLLWEYMHDSLHVYKGTYDRAAMREVRWAPYANSPDTYTMKDKDFLLASDMLFARKFSSEVDREIIDFIQKEFAK
ncbi:hypothetical protein HQ41_05325 [Porphyromonas sp. COT-290 OH860]|nr:hypothetical protein HQ41_05325 [Porphyromonas sp. COT-290 OH860]